MSYNIREDFMSAHTQFMWRIILRHRYLLKHEHGMLMTGGRGAGEAHKGAKMDAAAAEAAGV